ncbi:hypothetical protein GCM10009060_22270 [Halorubrum trapanicum]
MDLTEPQIREYDRRAIERNETETATFGLGCFWGPDARFGAIDGVVRTRVGTLAARHATQRITP